jgi:arginine-tRNA-protein transferase
LPIKEFILSKSQKKKLRKVVHFLTCGEHVSFDDEKKLRKHPEPDTKNAGTSLRDWMRRLLEDDQSERKYRLTITQQKAQMTEEVFQLYRKYQMQVHHDSEAMIQREAFERFLVHTPLKVNKENKQ